MSDGVSEEAKARVLAWLDTHSDGLAEDLATVVNGFQHFWRRPERHPGQVAILDLIEALKDDAV